MLTELGLTSDFLGLLTGGLACLVIVYSLQRQYRKNEDEVNVFVKRRWNRLKLRFKRFDFIGKPKCLLEASASLDSFYKNLVKEVRPTKELNQQIQYVRLIGDDKVFSCFLAVPVFFLLGFDSWVIGMLTMELSGTFGMPAWVKYSSAFVSGLSIAQIMHFLAVAAARESKINEFLRKYGPDEGFKRQYVPLTRNDDDAVEPLTNRAFNRVPRQQTELRKKLTFIGVALVICSLVFIARLNISEDILGESLGIDPAIFAFDNNVETIVDDDKEVTSKEPHFFRAFILSALVFSIYICTYLLEIRRALIGEFSREARKLNRMEIGVHNLEAKKLSLIQKLESWWMDAHIELLSKARKQSTAKGSITSERCEKAILDTYGASLEPLKLSIRKSVQRILSDEEETVVELSRPTRLKAVRT